MKLKHRYSDGIFNKKIVIIGLYPPPLGGIAVHINRVIKKLENQKNLIKVIDVGKIPIKWSKLDYFAYLFRFIYQFKPDIIYYHTLSLRSWPLELISLILLKWALKSEFVLIDHTPRFFYKKGPFYKKIVSFLLYYIDKQVLIGDSTYKAYTENIPRYMRAGQDTRDAWLRDGKLSIESPYLSPDFKQRDEIFEKYPEDLKKFLGKYSPLILINGSAARLFNNLDLYGFDMALELLDYLNPERAKRVEGRTEGMGLIIVMAEIGDKSYFDKIYSKIKGKKNIYLLLGCKEEIWPLFSKIDLFIRPTCSDAYGISIQEALEMKVPVIASNVCHRPEGTILFESRNQKEFNNKVKLVLSQFMVSVRPFDIAQDKLL